MRVRLENKRNKGSWLYNSDWFIVAVADCTNQILVDSPIGNAVLQNDAQQVISITDIFISIQTSERDDYIKHAQGIKGKKKLILATKIAYIK